jgi:hypothetical protein
MAWMSANVWRTHHKDVSDRVGMRGPEGVRDIACHDQRAPDRDLVYVIADEDR